MPIAWRAASSASCSAGMYSREPTNACPRGMLYVALTKLTALATLPAQPTYCRLTPQVAVPGERFHPGEVHTQPPQQLGQFLPDPASLYHGRSGHLVIFRCRHNTG